MNRFYIREERVPGENPRRKTVFFKDVIFINKSMKRNLCGDLLKRIFAKQKSISKEKKSENTKEKKKIERGVKDNSLRFRCVAVLTVSSVGTDCTAGIRTSMRLQGRSSLSCLLRRRRYIVWFLSYHLLRTRRVLQ